MYRGKFRFQNRLGQPYSLREIYSFCFVLLCIRGQIPSTSTTGGLYSEGRFNGRIFVLRFWGDYIQRGLYMEGLIFGILRYVFQGLAPKQGIIFVLTLHFWCDPQIGCLKKIQVHKCLATQETIHLLKFSDLIKVCMSHH